LKTLQFFGFYCAFVMEFKLKSLTLKVVVA